MTKPTRKQTLAGLIGTGAAGALIAFVGAWEGKSNVPYLDIVNVRTVCYGETQVAMRRYTDQECRDMLERRLVDYAGPVLDRNPELKGHDNQIIAAASLAYNIGVPAYNRSTVARRFSDGNWRGACDAFLMWSRAGGRTVKGLLRRRQAEREVCLRGL